jgi:hypothetical protein
MTLSCEIEPESGLSAVSTWSALFLHVYSFKGCDGSYAVLVHNRASNGTQGGVGAVSNDRIITRRTGQLTKHEAEK